MYYQFTKDCCLGVEQIDEEHAKLFYLINTALEKIADSTATLDDAKALVDELRDYARVHFEHEEAYMQEQNDPELPGQKREHAAFSAKMDSMYGDLKELDESLAKAAMQELVDFLAKWLYRHIISSDIMIGKLAPLAEEITKRREASERGEALNAPLVQFTEEYRTGIPLVDDEHKKLFEIIQRTYDTIHNDNLPDKYDHIIYILKELKEYTEQHFSDEEAYMEKIHYEGLESQRRAHEAFIDRLQDLDPYGADDNQEEYLDEIVEFLLGWLQNHILLSDKLIPVVPEEEH